MDVEICWKWFNDVFFPSVRGRTARTVLLLLDNSPEHFEAFERDHVKLIFFPPNCTSWKLPCDMGIIAALKKGYKYLYLSDVLQFHDLDEDTKARKKNWAFKYVVVLLESHLVNQHIYWMQLPMLSRLGKQFPRVQSRIASTKLKLCNLLMTLW